MFTQPEKRLLDSLAAGRYMRRDLYRAPDDYEVFFNRPWHGLAKSELDVMLDELVDARLLQIRRGGKALSTVELTVLGGKSWEQAFQVDWSRYFDSVWSPRGRRGLSLSIVSVSESICWQAAEILLDEMLRANFPGLVAKARTTRWHWSPWKVFPAASSLALDFRALGDSFDAAFDKAWIRASEVRDGWKKSAFD